MRLTFASIGDFVCARAFVLILLFGDLSPVVSTVESAPTMTSPGKCIRTGVRGAAIVGVTSEYSRLVVRGGRDVFGLMAFVR